MPCMQSACEVTPVAVTDVAVHQGLAGQMHDEGAAVSAPSSSLSVVGGCR